MTDYEPRWRVRNAVRELAALGGGHTVERPVMRSKPDAGTTREPDPLHGITAAVALERAARTECLDLIRYAREDGLGWAQVAVALGLTGESYGMADSPASRAYAYGMPGYRGISPDWFLWRCPSCGGNIRDYGPELGPHEAEQGHAEGCARFAATLAAWERAWAEDGSEEGSGDG